MHCLWIERHIIVSAILFAYHKVSIIIIIIIIFISIFIFVVCILPLLSTFYCVVTRLANCKLYCDSEICNCILIEQNITVSIITIIIIIIIRFSAENLSKRIIYCIYHTIMQSETLIIHLSKFFQKGRIFSVFLIQKKYFLWRHIKFDVNENENKECATWSIQQETSSGSQFSTHFAYLKGEVKSELSFFKLKQFKSVESSKMFYLKIKYNHIS